MTVSKVDDGRFFEDFRVGQLLNHATPRTIRRSDMTHYHALYPCRHAMMSSDDFARTCGLREAPLEPLALFHIVFGKSVPDISVNAIANLGYAEGRFFQPVYAGDTIRSMSEVIGLKETSSGGSGIVWVRTRGVRGKGEIVVEYVRWVMVRKRKPRPPSTVAHVPQLRNSLAADELPVPRGLGFGCYDYSLAGDPYRLRDYTVGERLCHAGRMTIEESDHMMATRLWQNTAQVHFDGTQRTDGRRLVYGGHVISLARALSFSGLANAQIVVAINGGTHANPCFAGDTIEAWTEVLEMAATETPGVGAIRLRTVASKAGSQGQRKGSDGRYLPDVFLDFDYWALMPT